MRHNKSIPAAALAAFLASAPVASASPAAIAAGDLVDIGYYCSQLNEILAAHYKATGKSGKARTAQNSADKMHAYLRSYFSFYEISKSKQKSEYARYNKRLKKDIAANSLKYTEKECRR